MIKTVKRNSKFFCRAQRAAAWCKAAAKEKLNSPPSFAAESFSQSLSRDGNAGRYHRQDVSASVKRACLFQKSGESEWYRAGVFYALRL
jgi:hypothetical protein